MPGRQLPSACIRSWLCSVLPQLCPAVLVLLLHLVRSSKTWGAPDATTVGVAAGTMGNIMGSLIGGPVAAFLIAKSRFESLTRTTNRKPQATGKAPELNNTSMIMMFAMCLASRSTRYADLLPARQHPDDRDAEIHRLSLRRCYCKKRHGSSWYRILMFRRSTLSSICSWSSTWHWF